MSGKCTCPWVDTSKPDYVKYHDEEWGVPIFDDQLIFEFLTLEAAQAGLSWYTVLRKRETYRIAFDQFNPNIIAKYDEAKVESLLQDKGIIRNRAKVLATINNAQRFLEIQQEFGTFSSYMWSWVGGKPIVNQLRSMKDYHPTTKESDAWSKDLKKRGFKWVGSTILYAHMQASGMVNDHITDCFRYQEILDSYPEIFV